MITKNNEKDIDLLTGFLNENISDTSLALSKMFHDIIDHKFGNIIYNNIEELFNEWLNRGLYPSVETLNIYLNNIFQKYGTNVDELKKDAQKNIHGLENIDMILLYIASNINSGSTIEDSIKKYIWISYKKLISIFMIQTSHLIISRFLMYFVGIDKKAWNTIIIQQVPCPYLDFYWNIRKQMKNHLPLLYDLNEFDWIFFEENIREQSVNDIQNFIKKYDEILDIHFGRLNKELNMYDYSNIDVDVWKKVYQKFFSEEDINKLGFVPTPNEAVDCILNLCDYKNTNKNLCKIKILDPACGSGTFLVESMARLLTHLKSKQSCHEDHKIKNDWERDQRILDTITENLYGIDIHPFSTFLTTINLIFQIIDIYANVKKYNSAYKLNLNIITYDTLSKKPNIRKQTTWTESTKQKISIERDIIFSKIYDKQFDLVVGNPPWGSVLRGGIGPLGDKNLKKDYKLRYTSAYDKYDIYVLFLERSINWLNENGTLGMITQNTWVSNKFGDGIKKVIRSMGMIDIFIDLGTVGDVIFPKYVVFPSILVYKKKFLGANKIKLIEVENR